MSPKDGYVVSSKAHIGSTEFKVILKLYQPLMGVNAYGVYSLLAAMASREPNLLERKMHKNLLDVLGLGLRDFYDARIHLEALGLLRTFEQEDDLGRVFIYELQAPLSAQEFFQDDLLSILLCDFLGKERYEELQKEFIVAKFTHPQAKEITKSLLEVYTVGRESLLQGHKSEKKLPKTPKMISKVDFELDMATLQALVASSFVPDKELLRCNDTLKTIALLYGLDEPALLHLLEQALDVHTNRVDQEVLKKLAATQFSRQVQATAPKVVQDTEKKDNKVSSTEMRLSANDQTLADVCRAYLPLEFIAVLKQQKNSFVTNLEQYTVKNLVEKQVLPNAVINVLLHYYLIVQNNAVLESKVANRFTAAAAKLAEEKIQTPEDAMIYMRKANQQAAAEKHKRQQPYYAKKRAVVQKETLPDWAKEAKQDKKTATKTGLTKEKRAALNAEIDELFAELEKGE